MIQVSDNILSYLKNLYGEDSAKKYLDFIESEPSTYIRVNPLKTSKEKLSELLNNTYVIKTDEINSIKNALKVTEGHDKVSKTIEHIIGLYYLQGLSSMIPPLILDPSPNDKVLDLCSAPGSKTTELGELMQNKGTIIANEIQLDRVKMLVYNLDRMNLVNTGVIHSKGEWLSKNFSEHFDKILVDAPCSGLGIIQKKGEVNTWWSKEKAVGLGELQLKLLVAAIKMLKVGGEIVYSTCTLSPEENELVINKILRKYPVEVLDISLPVKSYEGFTSYEGEELSKDLSKARRILPWEADSDGFFIIKLKKTAETRSPEQNERKPGNYRLTDADNKEIKNYLAEISDEFGIEKNLFDQYKYIIKNKDIFFVNSLWDEEDLGIYERVGTRFGVIDKRGGITLHTQAAQVLQNFITEKIFLIEDQDDLKKYLEGGIIKKETGFSGQCVVKYRDQILGTAVVTEAGIKSRFPRAKRTQEINTDF